MSSKKHNRSLRWEERRQVLEWVQLSAIYAYITSSKKEQSKTRRLARESRRKVGFKHREGYLGIASS